jgi:hypothetical protein
VQRYCQDVAGDIIEYKRVLRPRWVPLQFYPGAWLMIGDGSYGDQYELYFLRAIDEADLMGKASHTHVVEAATCCQQSVLYQ